MNIEFCHLSNIEIADIISLLTNDQVLKHMPLAKDSLFDEKQCLAWVKGKEKQWQDQGYGPWAFLVDNKFAGWGGLQYEDGDADLALVLHPQYWGFGKKIFNEIIRRAFNEMGMESITILLPPTRNKLKRIYLLGFELESEIMLSGELFIKYRLYKPSI